jgi:Zn-dependent peptidase ImmA (M78 family)
MRVPTSFKLGAHTWKIRRKKMEDFYGMCDCDNHIIYISTFVNNKPTTELEQFSTFIHELGHAVLSTMGLPDDEQLVRGAEELFLQVIMTSKYAKPKRIK